MVKKRRTEYDTILDDYEVPQFLGKVKKSDGHNYTFTIECVKPLTKEEQILLQEQEQKIKFENEVRRKMAQVEKLIDYEKRLKNGTLTEEEKWRLTLYKKKIISYL